MLRFTLERVDEPYFNWIATQDDADDADLPLEDYYQHYNSAKAWCYDNLVEKDWNPFDEEWSLFFRREIDATAFKLVWG